MTQQNLAGRRLLFQALGQLNVAVLQFFEQARVSRWRSPPDRRKLFTSSICLAVKGSTSVLKMIMTPTGTPTHSSGTPSTVLRTQGKLQHNSILDRPSNRGMVERHSITDARPVTVSRVTRGGFCSISLVSSSGMAIGGNDWQHLAVNSMDRPMIRAAKPRRVFQQQFAAPVRGRRSSG